MRNLGPELDSVIGVGGGRFLGARQLDIMGHGTEGQYGSSPPELLLDEAQRFIELNTHSQSVANEHGVRKRRGSSLGFVVRLPCSPSHQLLGGRGRQRTRRPVRLQLDMLVSLLGHMKLSETYAVTIDGHSEQEIHIASCG
jgi:hypothetical protein